MKRTIVATLGLAILLVTAIPSAAAGAAEPCTPQVGTIDINVLLPAGTAWIDDVQIWYVLLEPHKGGGPVQALWGYLSCRE